MNPEENASHFSIALTYSTRIKIFKSIPGKKNEMEKGQPLHPLLNQGKDKLEAQICLQ